MVVAKFDSILDEEREDDSAGLVTGVSSVSGTTNRITVSPTTGATVVDISASYVGQSSITTLGTIGTGTWQATPVGAIYGGTAQSTVTTGDLLYGSASNVWSKLADVATGSALISGGVTTAPSWGKIGLTTHVSGTLGTGNGGANNTSYTTNGVLRYDGSKFANDSTLTYDGSELSLTATAVANGALLINNSYSALSGTVRGAFVAATLSAASASSARYIGLAFSVAGNGAGDMSNGLALTGIDGNASYNGSGTVTGIAGGLLFCGNTSGTVVTARGIGAYGIFNDAGHITTALHLDFIDAWGGPPFTANNQTRVKINFGSGMPTVGAFTGCVPQLIWSNFDSTSANDGWAMGTARDTIIYRGASAQLNLTGSLVASVNVTAVNGTFSTAVISPSHTANASMTVQPAAAASRTLTLSGAAGSALGSAGSDTFLKAGNATGLGAANGGSIKQSAGTKTSTGTAGSVITYMSNGTTKVTEVNDTGLGFFATAPVAQQTGVDAAAALVNFGLLTSPINSAGVVATGRSTAQTAAVATVATYSVPAADHSYDVSANVNVTTSTLHSFSVQVDYTDETNTARTLTLPVSQLAGTFVTAITNGTGAGPYEGASLRIRCKASTTITIKTTGTFTTVTYNVEGSVVLIS